MNHSYIYIINIYIYIQLLYIIYDIWINNHQYILSNLFTSAIRRPPATCPHPGGTSRPGVDRRP